MPPPPIKPPGKGPPPKKKKGPAEATAEQLLSRAKGTLLGLAVGDALGSTLESKKLNAEQFPTLNAGMHTEMRGGGPFALRRGQVTKDTQMATCLAISLRRELKYEVVETGKVYAKWMAHAFDVAPPVRSALELILEGRSAEYTGKRVWLESSQKVVSNAALVRCPPLGVFFRWDQTARITATLEDTAITHFSPQCQLASVILNAVIATANTTAKEKIDKADALKAIEAELSIAAAQLGRLHPDFVRQVSDANEWLRSDIQAAQDSDPMLYGPDLHMHLQENYVRVCLRLALWELWHAPTFEAALLDVVNRGGDTDTNAAVVGALFGAVHGDAAIPEYWATPVIELFGMTALFTTYHPRELLALTEVLPEPKVPFAAGPAKK
jgi:ADP-ribosyl-[dinitrogen reductase] hydrolase